MDKKTQNENAVWGTVTLALPHLVEWLIEGSDIAKSGNDLQPFLQELNEQSKNRPVALSINLLLSLPAR